MSPPPEPGPTLLPQNRKLRHLRGIYLRNLSFVRPRGRATDDANLPTTPSKLAVLREGAALTHARSSESLASLAVASKSSSAVAAGKSPQKGRPRSGTLTSLGAVERQKGLEASVRAKLADGFLSLHVEDEEEPIYISEVVEQTANFTFRHFDLNHLHAGITRASRLTIKFWARRQGEDWIFLLEDHVDMRNLGFVGSVENKLLPPNGLVFHLVDGVYSADVSSRSRQPKKTPPVPSSSYNTLMKLATLDSSYQDALATHHSLQSQIDDQVTRLSGGRGNALPQQRDKVRLARRYVSGAARALEAASAGKRALEGSLRTRREAMGKGRDLQERVARDVANAQEKLAAARDEVARTRDEIRGQRRRICSDLADIFDIRPVPGGGPLEFRICGIPLPNTTAYDDMSRRRVDEDALSAALGHVAFVANALQFYLAVPLPYPVTPHGSRSSIRDDISLLADGGRGGDGPGPSSRKRDFPLYLPRGGSTAGHFRFEYGWFLLNKDVEALCAGQRHQGPPLRVVDIRQTLPNLKYLLFVCSAGADELPERKRGGVRALTAAVVAGRKGGGHRRGPAAAGGSGSATADGTAAAGGFTIPFGDDGASSVASRRLSADSTALESEVGSPDSGLMLPFGGGETKMTLRTKGLRENVSS